MQRRVFVKSGALALVTMGLSPSFLRRATFGLDLRSGAKGKVLICLFQRGAAACDATLDRAEAPPVQPVPRTLDFFTVTGFQGELVFPVHVVSAVRQYLRERGFHGSDGGRQTGFNLVCRKRVRDSAATQQRRGQCEDDACPQVHFALLSGER